jgi:cytochrome b561
MVLSNNKSTLIGLVFLVAFFLQLFLKLEWQWLFNLQQGEMYKRWTGLVLALFIAFQWVLSLTRTVKKWRPYAMKMQSIHKWIGALSPLFFYVHCMSLGYGYLALLSYIFIANTLLGYFNLDVIKNNSDVLFKGWMITHVALSLVITILMFFHIVMVFYYK